MRVEMDVYSGRPNPTWTLTKEEGEELTKRIAALPQASTGSVSDALGYRGLVVTPSNSDAAGFNSMTLSRGIVVMERPQGEQKLLDAGRNVERWLFQTGRGHIDDGLFNATLPTIAP